MHPYYKQFSEAELLSWQGVETTDYHAETEESEEVSMYDKSDQWEVDEDVPPINMETLGMTWGVFF